MADLGKTYDANTIPPAQPFEVLPTGNYLAQLVDSDMKTTKEGKGGYLWLEFEILEGPLDRPSDTKYAGRKLWDRLNLHNCNQQAVDIAERQFSALCHAAGKLIVSDSTTLHGAVVLVTVRVRPVQEASAENGWKSFDASNEIRGYSPPTKEVIPLPFRRPHGPLQRRRRV